MNMATDPARAIAWLTALRDNDYRVTEVQAFLVALFVEIPSPFSAEQAWEVARMSRPETGRATVYRTLDKLEALGLIQRVHGFKGCHHFIPSSVGAAMLFICNNCGQVDYLDRAQVDRAVADTEQRSGHQITESRIELFGVCANCLHPASST